MRVATPAPGLDDDLPSERRMRMQNEGLLPRGPSPQFSAGARAPAPAPYSPSFSPGAGASGQPATGAAGSAPTATPVQPYSKMRHSLLQGREARALKDLQSNTHKDDDGTITPNDAYNAALARHQAALGELDDYEKTFLGRGQATPPPTTAPAPTAAPTPTGQPAGPAPYTNPDTGNPQARAPITDENRIDTTSSAYQDRRREGLDLAYKTAGDDLRANPQLGAKMPQHTPLPPLTVPPGGMGNSPADYRQASAQAHGNQASIARVNQAGDDRVNNASAAQIQQNQGATAAVDRYQAGQANQVQQSTAALPGATAPGQKPTKAIAHQYVMKFGDTQKAIAALKQQGYDPSGYAD